MNCQQNLTIPFYMVLVSMYDRCEREELMEDCGAVLKGYLIHAMCAIIRFSAQTPWEIIVKTVGES